MGGVVEGALFAGYHVERRLGSGGMGTVYSVRHPRLPRKDALKVLSSRHAEDPEFRARFLREAEIAARLQHPNLVTVRDRGDEDGQLWIAMQYVDGADAAELIRHCSDGLAPARAVGIVAQAAEGLDEIHRSGLLHRDVKPANILVAEQDDGSDRVLVTDFGIARSADESTTLAAGGGTAATLAYAAPEQIDGTAVDHRADVYSLGCTLYHLLTGSVPFPRDSPGAVMYAHLNEPAPRPSAQKDDLPPSFDDVIAMAMSKDPGDRYRSCGALAEAARLALADDPVVADTLGTTDHGGRRDRLLAAALVVIVAVAATVSTLLLRDGDPTATASPPPTTPARPSVNAAEWGAYAYIVETFAELLPPSPLSFGYQGLGSCLPMRGKEVTTSFDTPATPIAGVYCTGDADPVRALEVVCNADRSPIFPGSSFVRAEGDERWTRNSGGGHVSWGSGFVYDRTIRGLLEIYFDEPSRNFCSVTVVGGDSGNELHARWWSSAPL
ncbi:serine/threonine-protein kinase [Nocardia aurea]|uniref:serine/threonine-protein kinase n=1 Tax=Nocardia aurea TaxID=2144174 RepID=UPI0033BA2AA0